MERLQDTGDANGMSRVQSIQRAFAVLGCLADGPLGVTDVAERTGLPKSTAARLLGSLADEAMVEQAPGESRYRLGPRILSLAAGVRPTRSLVALARPHLAALAESIGEVAGLSLLDGRLVHYVDQVDSPHPVGVRDWTGTRLPLHAVSSGLVLLANLQPAEEERFLSGTLERFGERTITDPAAIRERLRQIRLDGFAWTRDEYAEGISSVAAAVADENGEVVAAVHVHGPSYRFPEPGADDLVATLVVAAAALVSGAIRQALRVRPG